MNTKTFDLALRAIRTQFTFQDAMQSSLNVMHKAFIVEYGEYLTSTGFADWKVEPRDEANMVVEMADMMAFVLSCFYYHKTDPEKIGSEYTNWTQLERSLKQSVLIFSNNASNRWTDIEVVFANGANEERFSTELMLKHAQRQYLDVFKMLIVFEPKALKYLVAKQTLNQFRQDNGYRNGKYEKHWRLYLESNQHIAYEGSEDNSYLTEVLDLTPDQQYARFNRLYIAVKQAKAN